MKSNSASNSTPLIGVGFSLIWAVALALLVPAPEKDPLVDASTHLGTLFGFGLFFGLLAALGTHLLFLRKQKRSVKVLAYMLSALAGGLSVVFVHG